MPERVSDQPLLARDLANFLLGFQAIDATDGPHAGDHSFHRGGSLSVYDVQTREAIAILRDRINAKTATEIWDRALGSRWEHESVWLHGDMSVGNLLVRDGRLCAVIDFGNLAVGDPACDLVMAWTVFDHDARDAFRATLTLDDETWARGRGWALWKALILAAELDESNAYEAAYPFEIIEAVLSDHMRDH
jgi:aminoglycoside phosphotransferase (APT) family kinase protein